MILQKKPSMLVECLTGDFAGNLEHALQVAASGLHVYAHNIETVERLTSFVRDRRATYRQSLNILKGVKQYYPHLLTKSSIMLGLGEQSEEVLQTLKGNPTQLSCVKDLRENDVDVVTLGQYMRPTKRHLKVHEYVRPEMFDHWAQVAKDLGFTYVASGPLIRSSYKAGEFYMENLVRNQNNKFSLV